MPGKTRIEKVGSEADLPAGLVSVIYYCPVCRGKHTYGADYFVQVGVPEACPNCGTVFDQNDQVHAFETDTADDLLVKRDDLRRQRGEKVPMIEKPLDPADVKSQRIKDLEQEIAKLKGDDVKGPRLGP